MNSRVAAGLCSLRTAQVCIAEVMRRFHVSHIAITSMCCTVPHALIIVMHACHARIAALPPRSASHCPRSCLVAAHGVVDLLDVLVDINDSLLVPNTDMDSSPQSG
jgi:hypothetical protein